MRCVVTQYRALVLKVSISPEKKTKQKDYLPKGQLPIIDQGQQLIGGYTDNLDLQLSCNLPVIVFGDHTRAVKYVDFPFGAGADGIKVLEPAEGIYPKFLYYATQYLVLRLEDRGYARHYQYIEKKELDIPTVSEQKRIVARIEELFSELDNGVETLRKTKQQLAVYRQAVLKDAFESCDNKVEQQFGETLVEKPRNGYSPKGVDFQTKYRNLTLSATTSGSFKEDCFKYIDIDISDDSYLWVKRNDILIQRANTIEYVGTAVLYQGEDDQYVYPDLMMKCHAKEGIIPQFLVYQLQSANCKKHFRNNATGTSGSMPKINQKTVMTAPIIMVPYEDQKRIVAEIEARLSVCDSIEKTVDTALQQAEAMRQSILKKAFEGRL